MYDVGGVRMPRPFKIRRFGHFGFNLKHLDAGIEFYTDVLGFRITDETTLLELLDESLHPFVERVVTDPRMIFTSNTSDHHALLLAHTSFGTLSGNAADNTVSQITWQVATLGEVIAAEDYLREQGVQMLRLGRDMPGGNWHVYFHDPDANIVELYYGMEQIGWTRNSRPAEMHYRGFDSRPPLPQMSEAAEVREALAKGIDIYSGYRPDETHLDEKYDVGGMLIPRPFKITGLGPFSLFTDRLDAMVEFYTTTLGFEITEETTYRGHRAVFLRNGTAHHSLALIDKALRPILGLSEHTTCMSVGMPVGSYTQLRAAVDFVQDRGYQLVDTVPPELHPGIDYAAHVRDPDGHLLQLYYYIEQIGWDGRPRPAELRPSVAGPWPDVIDAHSDTYADLPFMGPLG